MTTHRHRAEQFKTLIEERVAINMIAVPTEDGPECIACGAAWEYDGETYDIQPGTEWHRENCWVVRVRAALAEPQHDNTE